MCDLMLFFVRFFVVQLSERTVILNMVPISSDNRRFTILANALFQSKHCLPYILADRSHYLFCVKKV